MSDSTKPNKPTLRRSRALPTLLTVPDLREELMAPIASEPQIPQQPAGAVEPEFAPPTMPANSLDDLVAAATAEHMATAVASMPSAADVPTPKDERWFAALLRPDLSTLGTIVATVVACVLVAQGMKATPTTDSFASASGDKQQSDVGAERPRIEVAHAPIQQPVGNQQPNVNHQQFGLQGPIAHQNAPSFGSQTTPPVNNTTMQPDPRMMQDYVRQQVATQGMPQQRAPQSLHSQANTSHVAQMTPAMNQHQAPQTQMVGGTNPNNSSRVQLPQLNSPQQSPAQHHNSNNAAQAADWPGNTPAQGLPTHTNQPLSSNGPFANPPLTPAQAQPEQFQHGQVGGQYPTTNDPTLQAIKSGVDRQNATLPNRFTNQQNAAPFSTPARGDQMNHAQLPNGGVMR